MPRVTRDDVARLAGTSTAVVSYVVNNGPRPVAPATRQRVLEAIEQLGYRPDSVAQAMASRRTNLLGMIVPDARQPFFAELAHAVERSASQRGKLVLLGNSDYVDDRELHYLREFLGMRVAGLILVTQGPTGRAEAELASSGARVALLHRRLQPSEGAESDAGAVMTDDVGGARLAVRHLLEHGHRDVWCLGGPVHPPAPGDPVVDHVAGWRQALAESEPAAGGHLVETPFDRYHSYRSSLRLLREPNRPTAVFCSTDDQAIGLLRAARELGLRVPDDLAVAGFDDIPEAELADPPLTTVGTDRAAMARAAVDLVLDDPEQSPAGAPWWGHDRVRRFPSHLVLRHSCGC